MYVRFAGEDCTTLWSSHVPSARGYLKDAIKRTTDGVPLYCFTAQNINTPPTHTSAPLALFPAFNNSPKTIPAKSQMTDLWVDVAIGSSCRKSAREAGSATRKFDHDSPAKSSDTCSNDDGRMAASAHVHDWEHVTWQLSAVCHVTYSKDGTCVLSVHEEREQDTRSACAPVRKVYEEESLPQGWTKCYDPAIGYVYMYVCVRICMYVNLHIHIEYVCIL
jgi:hypothetical protein